MSRLETQIAEAITAYIDTELYSAVQDQVCNEDIASEIDLDDVVCHLDLDYRFDQAIDKWLEDHMEYIDQQYKRTVSYIVEGLVKCAVETWLRENAHRFDPLHRRCWRWVTLVCKNNLNWRKKNEA